MTSEVKPTAIEAWHAVMCDVLAIRKDSVNKQQNFNFRGVDAVMNTVGPVLRTHGVVVVPVDVDSVYEDIEVGSKRTAMRECALKVTYRVFGPAGDHFDMMAPGSAADSGDKHTAKAASVAYRIALLQGLTIPTDEQDPDETTFERSGPAAQHIERETAQALAEAGPEGPNWFSLGWASEEEYNERLAATQLAVKALTEESRAKLKEIWHQNVSATPIADNMMDWWEQQIDVFAAKDAAATSEPEREY